MRFNPFFRSPIRSLSRGWRLLLAFLALRSSSVVTLPNYPYHKSLLLPYYTHTQSHRHTPFSHCSTLLSLGISTSCWKTAFSKALATHIQPQTPSFSLPHTPCPFRSALLHCILSPKHTTAHTHTVLLVFFSCGEQSSSG